MNINAMEAIQPPQACHGPVTRPAPVTIPGEAIALLVRIGFLEESARYLGLAVNRKELVTRFIRN